MYSLLEQANTGATTSSTISTLVSELCVESNIPVPPVRAASPAPPVGVPEEAGRLNGLSPRQDRETGSCCSSTPVFQNTHAGLLYTSTLSPLLCASESPKSVGLRGLEDEINELALQLAKLLLSSPVLEVAVRNPRYRCSLTERPGASSSSSSPALRGSRRATQTSAWGENPTAHEQPSQFLSVPSSWLLAPYGSRSNRGVTPVSGSRCEGP